MAVDPRIARILGKLEVVRGMGIETFGAETHGFSLAPPLSEAAVAAYEAKHGIMLPDEYRLFLLQAGASGAGPYYGIVHPDRWGDADGLDDPKRAIVIADQGCAYYATLVTAGPERGRIMYVSLDGGAPFFPDNPDFLSWYERWLDELSWGYQHHWFGTQMPGDEATLAAIARSATDDRRNAALAAMFQVPLLGPDAREAVALRVRDTDPHVRTTALRLVKDKNLVVDLEVHLRRALTDDAVAVRISALEALAGSTLDWLDAARTALADPDDTFAASAARLLNKAKQLGETDLLALLPRTGTRRIALEAARTIHSPAVFDALIAAGPDDEATRERLGESHLGALVAHAMKRTLDASRREQLFAILQRRVAEAGTGKLSIQVAVGLRALAADEPAALAALLQLLEHPHCYNRYDAAGQLGELGDGDALPALRAITDDTTMPRHETATGSQSTAWSVGVAAQKAIAKIEASLAKRS